MAGEVGEVAPVHGGKHLGDRRVAAREHRCLTSGSPPGVGGAADLIGDVVQVGSGDEHPTAVGARGSGSGGQPARHRWTDGERSRREPRQRRPRDAMEGAVRHHHHAPVAEPAEEGRDEGVMEVGGGGLHRDRGPGRSGAGLAGEGCPQPLAGRDERRHGTELVAPGTPAVDGHGEHCRAGDHVADQRPPVAEGGGQLGRVEAVAGPGGGPTAGLPCESGDVGLGGGQPPERDAQLVGVGGTRSPPGRGPHRRQRRREGPAGGGVEPDGLADPALCGLQQLPGSAPAGGGDEQLGQFVGRGRQAGAQVDGAERGAQGLQRTEPGAGRPCRTGAVPGRQPPLGLGQPRPSPDPGRAHGRDQGEGGLRRVGARPEGELHGRRPRLEPFDLEAGVSQDAPGGEDLGHLGRAGPRRGVADGDPASTDPRPGGPHRPSLLGERRRRLARDRLGGRGVAPAGEGGGQHQSSLGGIDGAGPVEVAHRLGTGGDRLRPHPDRRQQLGPVAEHRADRVPGLAGTGGGRVVPSECGGDVGGQRCEPRPVQVDHSPQRTGGRAERIERPLPVPHRVVEPPQLGQGHAPVGTDADQPAGVVVLRQHALGAVVRRDRCGVPPGPLVEDRQLDEQGGAVDDIEVGFGPGGDRSRLGFTTGQDVDRDQAQSGQGRFAAGAAALGGVDCRAERSPAAVEITAVAQGDTERSPRHRRGDEITGRFGFGADLGGRRRAGDGVVVDVVERVHRPFEQRLFTACHRWRRYLSAGASNIGVNMGYNAVFSDDQRAIFGNDAKGLARFDQALADWGAIQGDPRLAIHIDGGGRASLHRKDQLLVATRDVLDDRLANSYRDIGVSDEEFERVRSTYDGPQQQTRRARRKAPDTGPPVEGVARLQVGTNQCVVAATEFLRSLGGRRPLRVAPDNVLWPFQGRVFGPAFPPQLPDPSSTPVASTTAKGDLPETRVKVAVLDTGYIPGNADLDRVTVRRRGDRDPWWKGSPPPPVMQHWVGGHGTHVAGVLASAAGYAVELHHFNVGGFGSARRVKGQVGPPLISDTDLAQAVRQALQLGCRVINMSLGGPTALDLGLAALSLAVHATAGQVDKPKIGDNDAVIVAAAGNEATTQPMFPAATKGVIAVGALDGGVRAEFSNYGPWVDCATGGVDVLGPYVSGIPAPPATPGGRARTFKGWATWSGTSFASPFVAGRIAARLATGATDSARVAAAMVLAEGIPLAPGEQLGVRIS